MVATVNKMLRRNFPILVLLMLAALVWTQRKSFAKVRPGTGGCGDDAAAAEAEAAEEDRKAAARGRRRR